MTLIETDGWCDGGAVLDFTGTGTVDGDAGKIEIAASVLAGTGGFTFDLMNGTYNGTTISGPYVIMGDGFDSDITGTATLYKK